MNSNAQIDQDRKWLLRTIELSRKCSSPRIYSVGCVVVAANGIELASGFTGETEYENASVTSAPHAEEIAIGRLSEAISQPGLCLYSTLEPCSERLSGIESCASRIKKSGLRRVVFGVKEPFDERLKILCRGAELLRQSGIEVCHFLELEEACRVAIKRADIPATSDAGHT